MFIAIFVTCVLNGECTVKTSSIPFYTRKECLLATKAKTDEEFTCLKVGGKNEKK